jgi:nicotinic acid mononucleotide adenylyltransferase
MRKVNQAILPGAFNPLHAAHIAMRHDTQQRLHLPVSFELSLENVDKPPISLQEAERRLQAFGEHPCWITRAATFTEKARIFPGSVFVVGADTMQRITDAQYYGHDARQLAAALATIQSQSCRFLVYGRKIDSTFCGSWQINLTPAWQAICDCVSETDFRFDISSTELRANW